MTPHAFPILLTKQTVCERLNLSQRTLEGMVNSEQFPKGVRVGKYMYWSEAAVHGWTIRIFGAQEAWTPMVSQAPESRRAPRAGR